VYLKVFFKKQTKKQCTVFIYFHVYHLEEERAGVKIWRESHGSPPQKYKLSFLSLSPREEVWKTFTESVFVWYDGWKLEHFQRGIYMHTVALVFNSVLKKHYNQILRKKTTKNIHISFSKWRKTKKSLKKPVIKTRKKSFIFKFHHQDFFLSTARPPKKMSPHPVPKLRVFICCFVLCLVMGHWRSQKEKYPKSDTELWLCLGKGSWPLCAHPLPLVGPISHHTPHHNWISHIHSIENACENSIWILHMDLSGKMLW